MISPLLSNVYLHYVVDLWFSRRVRKQCRGEAYYFRFADDFVACFQYKEEAERFRGALGVRLKDSVYNWRKRRPVHRVRHDLPGIMRAGEERNRRNLPFWDSRIIAGRPGGILQGETSHQSQEAAASLRKFTEWARRPDMYEERRDAEIGAESSHRPSELLRHNGQLERCSFFVYRTTSILFKWLNRKSQRKAYTWEGFNQALAWVDGPEPGPA